MKRLIFFFSLFFSLNAFSSELVIQTKEKAYVYQTDIADTPYKQQLGLMFQRELPDNYGMTFLFERPLVLKMWMKNTYLSLDMIFFDENGVITHIHKNAEPFSEKLISSQGPAQGVIEVIAGTAEEKNIQIGDKIKVIP